MLIWDKNKTEKESKVRKTHPIFFPNELEESTFPQPKRSTLAVRDRNDKGTHDTSCNVESSYCFQVPCDHHPMLKWLDSHFTSLLYDVRSFVILSLLWASFVRSFVLSLVCSLVFYVCSFVLSFFCFFFCSFVGIRSANLLELWKRDSSD